MTPYIYPVKLELESLNDLGEWEIVGSYNATSYNDLKKKISRLTMLYTLENHIYRFFVVTKSYTIQKNS